MGNIKSFENRVVLFVRAMSSTAKGNSFKQEQLLWKSRVIIIIIIIVIIIIIIIIITIIITIIYNNQLYCSI